MYVRQEHRVDAYGSPKWHKPDHPLQNAVTTAQGILSVYGHLPEGSARRDARAKLATLVRGIALSVLVTGAKPPLPEDGALRRLLLVAVRDIRREIGGTTDARGTE